MKNGMFLVSFSWDVLGDLESTFGNECRFPLPFGGLLKMIFFLTLIKVRLWTYKNSFFFCARRGGWIFSLLLLLFFRSSTPPQKLPLHAHVKHPFLGCQKLGIPTTGSSRSPCCWNANVRTLPKRKRWGRCTPGRLGFPINSGDWHPGLIR